MKCPKCGRDNAFDVNFCIGCGERLPKPTMTPRSTDGPVHHMYTEPSQIAPSNAYGSTPSQGGSQMYHSYTSTPSGGKPNPNRRRNNQKKALIVGGTIGGLLVAGGLAFALLGNPFSSEPNHREAVAQNTVENGQQLVPPTIEKKKESTVAVVVDDDSSSQKSEKPKTDDKNESVYNGPKRASDLPSVVTKEDKPDTKKDDPAKTSEKPGQQPSEQKPQDSGDSTPEQGGAEQGVIGSDTPGIDDGADVAHTFVIAEPQMTWKQMREAARNLGHELAVVHSDNELDVLVSTIKENPEILETHRCFVLGALKPADDNGVYWIGETGELEQESLTDPENVLYKHWDKEHEEPSQELLDGSEEAFVVLIRGEKAEDPWHFALCTDKVLAEMQAKDVVFHYVMTN